MKNVNMVSLLKYEGDINNLVWKYPEEDFYFGSQLIVHESQQAVFFKDGQALDLFTAGRHTLTTEKMPIMEKAYSLPSDSNATFHSEVYFINTETKMGLKWGTDSKVRMLDPASGMFIELGASGEFNIRVTDARKLLIKVVATSAEFRSSSIIGEDDGRTYFKALIMTQVKSALANAIKEKNINILEVDAQLDVLSEALREKINAYLENYGLFMPEFFVSRVVTPDDDKNFKRLKEQYAEQYLRVKDENIRKLEAEAAYARKAVEANTEANIKIIEARANADALRLKKAAEADGYRMQAEAEALEMKMKGYTYQQETSRQVGLEAMKNGIAQGVQGAGGTIGDLASLGVGLGAMSGVIGMTKEAMEPIIGAGTDMGNKLGNTIAGIWDCSCGAKGLTSNFCPNCGKKRGE